MGRSRRQGTAPKGAENQAQTGKKRGVSQVSGCERHTPQPDEWPLKDQIRWAEWNLETMVAHPELVDASERLPKRKDLEIWLLHKRDHNHLSLRQLARRFHGSIDSKSVSSVRRAIERVEKRNPGTSKFVGLSKSEQRTLALMLSGVPPGI
jgi:hypothetical protein